MSLATYKSELLSVLSDAYDEASWSDAALEAALREALGFFHPFGNVVEESFVLIDSGYEHELLTLGAYEVVAIGWPWGDGYYFDSVVRPWRLITETKIRMDDLDLDSGETVRVRYRPRHAIKYLDGESADTLSDLERGRFMLAAGSFAIRGRIRYLAHREGNEERISALEKTASNLMDQFYLYSAGRFGSSNYVTWGRLGQ